MEGQSLFALAPELLGAVLPKRIKLTDEDESRIRLPDWRYVEIEDEVLELYRELDVRFVPLDPLAMAQALGYGPIPYRAFGQVVYPMLKAASPDALTIWIFGQDRPVILFDDRQTPQRCAFTMMHEIGHARLGHREHSKLAETEANHFAAAALCPLPLLDKSEIRMETEVSSTFGISLDCASHRLEALRKWQSLPASYRNKRFGQEVLERLRFKTPLQTTLFETRASS